MMNKKTRKLSKIPEEVRREIEPYFMQCEPVLDEDSRKLPKLDNSTAEHVRTGLTVSLIFAYETWISFFVFLSCFTSGDDVYAMINCDLSS